MEGPEVSRKVAEGNQQPGATAPDIKGPRSTAPLHYHSHNAILIPPSQLPPLSSQPHFFVKTLLHSPLQTGHYPLTSGIILPHLALRQSPFFPLFSAVNPALLPTPRPTLPCQIKFDHHTFPTIYFLKAPLIILYYLLLHLGRPA